jgi:hypothetical protein
VDLANNAQTKNKKEKIETAIKKAIKEYGPTFKKLAEE